MQGITANSDQITGSRRGFTTEITEVLESGWGMVALRLDLGGVIKRA
jgi:hypothetical protein